MDANTSANLSPASRGDPVRRQQVLSRRKLLHGFMLLACAGILLIYLLILYTDLGTDIPVENLLSLQNATIAIALGAAICYLIARRGRVEIAACLFLGLALLAAIFQDDPQEVIGGRSMIGFPIVIIIAGLLLPPQVVFVFAGASTLAVTALAFLSAGSFVQVASDAIVFFVVAAITWYYTSRLERANQELARSRAELEQFNAELEQRIDSRTAELRQANVQLAQSSRLKDEFLATMSHELRTPLAGVLMVADGLETGLYGPLTNRQHQKVRQVAAGGRRLLKLVQQVLDYAQIEAGELRLALRPAPALALCREAVQELAAGATAKGLSLQLRSDLDAGACIDADPHCLREILITLLDNAIKFTPEAGSVGIDVLPGPQPGSLHFVVWDTGIGIAVDDLPLLFQPFRQVDSGLSRGYEGAGLSLALAQRLAVLQGGALHVASTPGEGSCFTLVMPRSGVSG